MLTSQTSPPSPPSSSSSSLLESLFSSKPLRVLVVRSDRIGDVILSTPVLESIQNHYPQAEITVLVRSQPAPLLKGLPFVHRVIVYDPEGKHSGFKGFLRLRRELAEGRFKIAVILQGSFRIALATLLAGIRQRIGPWSQLYSFFLYNRGMRQHRSQVEMHETDYNLQLLRKMGIRVPTRSVDPKIHLSPETEEKANQWLRDANVSVPFIVVHPGMGGSALNWPLSHYVELISALIQDGKRILITGGLGEKTLLEEVRRLLQGNAEKVTFFQASPETSVEFLAALLKQSDLMIAPSTGPLHLAIALGKRVVTFYSPIRVQSAIRWGPYLSDEKKASVLVPEVYCGQDFKCLGNLCNYYLCMKGITVKQVLRQVHFQLEEEARKKVHVSV